MVGTTQAAYSQHNFTDVFWHEPQGEAGLNGGMFGDLGPALQPREFPLHFEAAWRASQEEGELVIAIPDNELMVRRSHWRWT